MAKSNTLAGRRRNIDERRPGSGDEDRRQSVRVLVRDVVEDSPAAKAGLKGSSTEVTIDGVKTTVGGDILVKVDDQPVKNFDNLLSYLVMYKSPGEKVKVEFLRDGKMQTAEITLAKRPAQ